MDKEKQLDFNDINLSSFEKKVETPQVVSPKQTSKGIEAPSKPIGATQEKSNPLINAQNHFIQGVTNSLQTLNINADTYQKMCGLNVITKMFDLAAKEGKTLSQFDQKEIIAIVQYAMALRLNCSAFPSECYVIIRKAVDKDKNWTQHFEFNIQGDGNDAILRNFGVDVKTIHPYWVVREDDEFENPYYEGIAVVPPKWKPKNYHSKIIKIVYPIEFKNGRIEYFIADRENVAENLKAHLSNNLMKEKTLSDTAKEKLIEKFSPMTLEELLNDKELRVYMSPSWKSAHAVENMILRKMRNNATKKLPKDFGNPFIASLYNETIDDYEQYRQKEVADFIDVDEEAENNKQTKKIASEYPTTGTPREESEKVKLKF